MPDSITIWTSHHHGACGSPAGEVNGRHCVWVHKPSDGNPGVRVCGSIAGSKEETGQTQFVSESSG